MLTFRRAHLEDADVLTDLTIASKAHWGYDEAFMERAHICTGVRSDTSG